MEKDPETIRLEALAKEKLKIPKAMRLTGPDGYVSLPAVPDMFYLNELVVWLLDAIEPKAESMIEKGDYEYDSTIEAIGYERIKKFPSSIRHLSVGMHSIKKQCGGESVVRE